MHKENVIKDYEILFDFRHRHYLLYELKHTKKKFLSKYFNLIF